MRGRYAKKRAARALRSPDPKNLAKQGLAKQALEVLEKSRDESQDRWGVTKTGRPVNLTRAEMKLRNFVVRRLAKGGKP